MAEPVQPRPEKKRKNKKAEPVTEMDEYVSGPGKTTIAPDVLVTIARLTALETAGVSRLSAVPGTAGRFRRGGGEGVLLEIEGNYLTADLYVVVNNNVNLREVSRNIQQNVTRAISEMVGMQVGRIHIHIEDIDYPTV
jgi:uncharacterized alkaline shock family protein YloU